MKRLFVLMSLFFIVSSSIVLGQSNWPIELSDEKGSITLFQPQVEKLTSIIIEGRCAVMVKTADFPDGVFGAIWFECNITTDKNERLVLLDKLEVRAFNFPDIGDGLAGKITGFLEAKVENNNYTLSLDRLIADLDLQKEIADNTELNNTPPEIIFKTEPSILVLVDGEPIFKEIENTSYNYLQNTPFFIVQDSKTKAAYLKGGNLWFQSNNVLDNWKVTNNPPADLLEIAKQAMSNEEDDAEAEEVEPDSIIPIIIVRTQPAELLQSDGEPEFGPLKGTNLLYLTNSNDDILLDIATQTYYVLISGRWYQTKDITKNDWIFVEPDNVPADFKNIPEESEISSVRSNVPGTVESKEAILENQIPQTAAVDRSDASLEVIYDGDPIFNAIEGTQMQFAVNTESSVLLITNIYYCCDNAVWFESKNAQGPWEVSTKIPDEVQNIPPSNPNYNVKYVYIYDVTPEVIYTGYTPGYVHSYVYHGCVFYGTGFYYHPWYGRYYYPRHYTYGFRVHYNPYAGWGFSFGYRYGSPYGWMTFGWHSNHRHGMWGPAGYRYGYAHRPPYGNKPPAGGKPSQKPSYGHRPSQGTGGGAAASNNIYQNRKDGVKPNQPSKRPSTGTQPSQRPSTGTQPSQKPSTGKQPAQRPSQTPSKPNTGNKPSQKPETRPNNVYTDKNGDVFRKEGKQWQKRNNGSWNNVQTPSQGGNKQQTRPSQPSQSSPSNLDREYNSRNRGTQRTQQYNQNRSSNQYRQSTPSNRSVPSQNRGGASGGRRR